MKKVDGQIVTRAKVIDVRSDKRIVFVAELAKPEEGFVLVVHANENRLGKPVLDFKIGEVSLVSFRIDPSFEFRASLNIVSEKLKAYLEKPSSRLGYKEGKLCFVGKMKYSDLVELVVVDDEKGFRAALEYLYLESNMNWASKVMDSGWVNEVSEKYPVGTLVDCTVNRLLSAGVIVDLVDNISGFVNAADINHTRRVTNVLDVLKVGESLKAKVTGYDEVRRNVSLSFAIPENSPYERFKTGQIVEGTVESLVDSLGAFVQIGLGYSGLVHISSMPRVGKKPSELYSKGEKIQVVIKSLRENKGKTEISLGLAPIVK